MANGCCYGDRRAKGPAVSTQLLQRENWHVHGAGSVGHSTVVAGQRDRLALTAQVLA